jgi:hypothetical protein
MMSFDKWQEVAQSLNELLYALQCKDILVRVS